MAREGLVAGVDIGSLSAEAVILADGQVLSYSIIPTGAESAKTARRAMEEALKGLELSLEALDFIVATGYGRVVVPFAQDNVSEISCHAKGSHYWFPTVRTVLDMGGQDCKAIRCDERGKVTNFVMNDKCAAGTGRFFEIMAQVMGLRLEDLGEISLGGDDTVPISSACAVFAKSEMVSLMRKGVPKQDILASLHTAITSRVYALLKRVEVAEDFVMTGGIAKNIGIVRRVAEKVGIKVLVPQEPQIIGALGAALFARERLSGR
jgi:predicted CoA-substrate-specific enzyme activase